MYTEIEKQNKENKNGGKKIEYKQLCDIIDRIMLNRQLYICKQILITISI